MRETSPYAITFKVALLSTPVIIGLALSIDIDWPWKITLAVLLPMLLYVATYVMVRRTVYSEMAQINTLIIESIKNEKFKSKMENNGANELDKLRMSVNRLISEKTSEIDHLKDLERLRKEFLGDVAHELRSPIFTIQGFIDTLLGGAYNDDKVRDKYLDLAAKHVNHLASLIEDLVTISRMEAGQIRLDLTQFDVTELIDEVTDLLEMDARKKNISLTTRSTNEVQSYVFADRAKVRQVLINLIGNSIKYGRPDGNTNISVTDDGPFRTLTVKVADNGDGIKEEHLTRIFERFYRVDKSRSRAEHSTGLGLAIVKHFVEAHKQTIEVTSKEGVGSIFSFTLEKVKNPKAAY